jgi:hypothetical protein
LSASAERRISRRDGEVFRLGTAIYLSNAGLNLGPAGKPVAGKRRSYTESAAVARRRAGCEPNHEPAS